MKMKSRFLSERELIKGIRRDFSGSEVPDLRLGIGDDAAVFSSSRDDWVITKDLLVEDFHFLFPSHPADLLGRKSLNINLSDLAAMGARPRFALLGLGMPDGTSPDWVRDFFEGLRSAAFEFGVALIGGDLTGADKITISVTALGAAPASGVIPRSGARPGDTVYVSGTLGDSAGGLALARRGILLGSGEREDYLLRAFLDPNPRVELGKRIGALGGAGAMIDVSDGLSTDLGHICEESGVGAEIEAARIPLSEALRELSPDPQRDALHGGEDYELILTIPSRNEEAIQDLSNEFALTRIGRITEDRKMILVHPDGTRSPLRKAGWQHFKG